MARNSQRGSNNNNPSGRNQFSGGVMDIAREQPFKAAAMTAAAVGAGVFLWSRRNQISDQIANLSDQFGEWSQNYGSSGGNSAEFGSFDDTAGLTTTGETEFSGTTGSKSRKARTTGKRSGMNATGGGNASIGASSGGRGQSSIR